MGDLVKKTTIMLKSLFLSHLDPVQRKAEKISHLYIRIQASKIGPVTIFETAQR